MRGNIQHRYLQGIPLFAVSFTAANDYLHKLFSAIKVILGPVNSLASLDLDIVDPSTFSEIAQPDDRYHPPPLPRGP